MVSRFLQAVKVMVSYDVLGPRSTRDIARSPSVESVVKRPLLSVGKLTKSGAEVKFGSQGSWIGLHAGTGVQRVLVRVKGKTFWPLDQKTDAWISLRLMTWWLRRWMKRSAESSTRPASSNGSCGGTECRQDTHSQYTSMQYSLITSAERTPRAWLKLSRNAFHLCAPEKNLSSNVAYVSPFVVLSPAVYHKHNHLPRSLFLLPRHKNTKHNYNNKKNSENTQYIKHISKLSQSTSCAIKNHSGRENLQSGENPRTTTPTPRPEESQGMRLEREARDFAAAWQSSRQLGQTTRRRRTRAAATLKTYETGLKTLGASVWRMKAEMWPRLINTEARRELQKRDVAWLAHRARELAEAGGQGELRVPRAPDEPSADERARSEVTHVPYQR